MHEQYQIELIEALLLLFGEVRQKFHITVWGQGVSADEFSAQLPKPTLIVSCRK